jgi:hypothetical protein
VAGADLEYPFRGLYQPMMSREKTRFRGRRSRVRLLSRGMVRRTSVAVTWGRGLPGLISRAFGPWPVPTPSVIIALTDVKE